MEKRGPGTWFAPIAVLALITSGCGGGGSSGPSDDPVISNLSVIFQARCTLPGVGTGTIEVIAFDFVDAQGDVPGGTVENTTTPNVGSAVNITAGVPSPGVTLTGTTSGRVTITFCVRFGSAVSIVESVTLTDAGGHRSNQLSATVGRPAGAPLLQHPSEGAVIKRLRG